MSERVSRCEQQFTKKASIFIEMIVSPNSLPDFADAIFLRAVDTHIEDGSIPSQSTF